MRIDIPNVTVAEDEHSFRDTCTTRRPSGLTEITEARGEPNLTWVEHLPGYAQGTR